MPSSLATVDPGWAWSAYQPTAEAPWNVARAAHLFRRAAFGASRAQLDAAIKESPAAVVERLITGPGDTADFDREMRTMEETVIAGNNAEQLPAWWLYRMLYTPDPFLEKITLFWHGHFATSAAKVKEPQLMLAQNALLRRDARGDFRRMVHAMSRDPAMLMYLDSATNRKTHPNENYARELLELFCLGLGNYTEKDIQELARCFTGWELRRHEFQYNEYQHDAGAKTLFEQRGNFGGDEAVDIVCRQPAAATFLVTKLFRYFIADEPAPESALIQPLADELRKNDFHLKPTLQRMLGSQLFFSQHALAQKIRSPIELGIGFLCSLEGSTNLYRLAQDLGQLGQAPFFPPNVKGWDGGRTWINSSTLIGRSNLVGRLVRDGGSRFGGGSLASLAEAQGWQTPEVTVDKITELLLARQLPAEVRQSLISQAARPGDRSRQLAELIHTLGSLPEFQLG